MCVHITSLGALLADLCQYRGRDQCPITTDKDRVLGCTYKGGGEISWIGDSETGQSGQKCCVDIGQRQILEGPAHNETGMKIPICQDKATKQ